MVCALRRVSVAPSSVQTPNRFGPTVVSFIVLVIILLQFLSTKCKCSWYRTNVVFPSYFAWSSCMSLFLVDSSPQNSETFDIRHSRLPATDSFGTVPLIKYAVHKFMLCFHVLGWMFSLRFMFSTLPRYGAYYANLECRGPVIMCAAQLLPALQILT